MEKENHYFREGSQGLWPLVSSPSLHLQKGWFMHHSPLDFQRKVHTWALDNETVYL